MTLTSFENNLNLAGALFASFLEDFKLVFFFGFLFAIGASFYS